MPIAHWRDILAQLMIFYGDRVSVPL